jgi:P-type Cu+ transporter
MGVGMVATQRVVFAIRGLECASCAIDVGRALRKIPGIAEININYMINKGYVEFDPERIGWDAVSKALSDRGYIVVKTR